MGVYGSPDLNNPNAYTDNSKVMIYCSYCGCHYSKHIRKCPQCGKKYSRPFYNRWWFWLFVLIIICSPFGNRNNSATHESSSPLATQSEVLQLSEEEYKAQCNTIPYSDIARNPNNYIGQKAVFTGKVIQVQESGKSTTLRVSVTQGEYGIWDDTVYVDYSKKSDAESRVLEDDIITMYGQLNGLKHYTAVFGNQISIPHLLAEYIDINRMNSGDI